MKLGYKQTEVGVIPEDWEVKRLGDVLTIKHGKNQSQVTSTSGMIPIYGSGGIIGWASKYLYDKPSVLIGRKGTIDSPYYMDIPFWTVDTMFYSEIFRNIDAKFIFYTFNTIDWYAYNEASGVPSLNAKTIESISIPLPPLPEQKAIAAALSDVDALLGGLERLIAKKRDLKQAAMQQLLTGQTRLPGFHGEWEVKTLGEIITRFSTGLNPRQNFRLNSGGNFFYVTIKNFEVGKLFLDENCDSIDETAFRRINERSDLRKDDILFSSIGRVGDAYLITETPQNWNINESVFTLRPDKSKVSPLMLFYLLTDKIVTDALNQGVTGSTFKSIKQAQLKAIPCQLPACLPEQIAIAEVLSDMDAELAALETQLHKTRALKQAMMQELLTGRTRLV
jgi:type I restriction enzyme S subunit